MSLVLSNKGKGMQSSSEQPLVGEERNVTSRITAAKETIPSSDTDPAHDFKSKMADDCYFLAGDDLDAILDMLEADEGVEEEFNIV